MRGECWRYSISNASTSPARQRTTSSASGPLTLGALDGRHIPARCLAAVMVWEDEPMGILRWFFGLVLLLLVGLGLAYYGAGKMSGPVIEIDTRPVVGQQSPLTVAVSSPGRQLDALTIQIEQGGQTFPVYALDPGAEPPPSD